MRSHAKATSAIAAIGCAIFLACICASPALAAKGVVGFVGGSGEQGGQFSASSSGPGGVGVNQTGTGATAGDIYVVDRGNNRIQQFHSDGTWVRTFGADVIAAKASEVQSVSISGATGGAFTLEFSSQSTASIPYGATAATVQSELEALPAIGAGNVAVSEAGSFTYTVTFAGALANSAQPQITINGASLTPGSATTKATTTQEGFASAPNQSNEIQSVQVRATEGTFNLTFGAQSTPDLPYNATPGEVQAALNALSSVSAGGGSLTVSGGPGDAAGSSPYVISFDGGPLAGADVAQITAASGATPLGGGSPTSGTTVITSNPGSTGLEVCDSSAGNFAYQCKKGLASAIAAGMNSPQGVAIEQSTGNLYVADQFNSRIDVYSASGEFEGAFGRKVKVIGAEAKAQFCTTATGCQVGEGKANAGAFGTGIGFPALAPAGSPAAGHLFVPSRTNRRIDELAPQLTGAEVTGIAFVRGFGWGVNAAAPAEEFQVCTEATDCKVGPIGAGVGQFAGSSPTALAIDASGRIYATDVGSGATANNRVQAFSSTPTAQGVFAAAALSGAPASTDVLVDPANQHVLALKQAVGEQLVLELDSSGAVLQSIEQGGIMPAATGLGALSGGGDIYMTTVAGLQAKPGFWILSSNLIPPGVTIEPVSTFTGTTASFEGRVITDDFGASYHFEYSQDGSTWTTLPGGSLSGDNSSHLVSASATGLEAHTEYQVRLVADKQYKGGSASAQAAFTTSAAPPIIESVSHSHVRDTSARLNATINPENEDTEYSFEYTDKASYEAEGFAGAISAPAPAGHASGPIAEVAQQLAGLDEKTAYVYRLLISNATGDDESAIGSFTTHATLQEFEPCPNEQFRVNRPSAPLPDCRAYEQASPLNKNGGNVLSESAWTKASPSGDRISFQAVAGLPGGDGSQSFPSYLATRKDGGWSTQGMLPAASSGESARVLGWTPDFDQVFGRVTKFGAGNALLSRSSADGSLSSITPYSEATGTGTSEYVGASTEGSVVIFNSRAQLAVAAVSPPPAAGLDQASSNLYAWDRETGDLYFAGSLPDGAAPAKGEVAGFWGGSFLAVKLGYIRDTNTVAEDGSVYFVDRGTGQLYRRLNPTAPETTERDANGDCIPDPDLACTVHVSASEKDEGNGENGHDAAGEALDKFMAASSDGAKAVFTSSEMLTNDAYTGIEAAHPKAIARADTADPGNLEIDWLLTSAREIAVDEAAGYVYWTDPAHGQIGRAKLDKSTFEPSYISGLDEPLGIAVIDEPSAEYVYWTERGELNSKGEVQAGHGTIGRADLDLSSVNPSCYTGLTNPRSIAVRPDFIYWTAPLLAEPTFGDLDKAGLSCDQSSIEQDVTNPVANGDVAVDSSHIYVSALTGNSGNVWIYDLDGTFVTTLVSIAGSTGPPGLALDGSHLYWTDGAHGKIGRSELDGNDVQESFISEAGRAVDPALAGTDLLWSTNQEVPPNSGNDIYAYDSEAPVGERLTDLAPSHDDKDGIEVQGVLGASADASYVYFVANGIPDGPIANSPNARNEEPEVGDCENFLGSNSPADPRGTCNLYLAHEGQNIFIARLDADNHSADESSSDSSSWIASIGEIGVSNVAEKTARVSYDGKTLLFRSQRQLTGYDNEGPECVTSSSFGHPPVAGHCPELYLYRFGEPGLTCVSCNPTGAPPDGFAELASITLASIGIELPAFFLSRNLSADGKRVFFESRDPLVTADVNGDETCNPDESYRGVPPPSCKDVYEWEAAGAGSCPQSAGAQGCVYLLSTGASPHPSFFADASLSGDDAFIYTYSKLVRQDEDDLLDVYDTSVGGGLSYQDALAGVSCEGEGCKGAVRPAPQGPSAGTQSFSGSGDPKPVHKKARHRKKKRRHHAKRRHAKRHEQRAKTTRRASR